jgi:hypothetical protein
MAAMVVVVGGFCQGLAADWIRTHRLEAWARLMSPSASTLYRWRSEM